MPNITLNFSAEDAARLRASLAGTPYPATVAGLKALLSDYLNSWLTEQERAVSRKVALASVVEPTPIVVS